MDRAEAERDVIEKAVFWRVAARAFAESRRREGMRGRGDRIPQIKRLGKLHKELEGSIDRLLETMEEDTCGTFSSTPPGS